METGADDDLDALEASESYASTDLSSTTDESQQPNKAGDDNVTVESEADSILDFSDSNPFGTF